MIERANNKGNPDPKIELRDANTSKLIWRAEADRGTPYGLAISPDGKLVASQFDLYWHQLVGRRNRQTPLQDRDQPEAMTMANSLPDKSSAQIREALRAGRKITAMRLYREATGASLADAKAFVDQLEAGSVTMNDAAPVEKLAFSLAEHTCWSMSRSGIAIEGGWKPPSATTRFHARSALCSRTARDGRFRMLNRSRDQIGQLTSNFRCAFADDESIREA